MNTIVEVNKNLTLLYCLLNRYNQAYGKPQHSLRIEVINHFKNYQGKEPKIEDYVHEHKLVVWALFVDEPPTFLLKEAVPRELQWHFDKGSTIKPYLTDFYAKTDFENFYNTELLVDLNKIKSEYEIVIAKVDVVNILESVWKTDVNQQMVIIPNPFTQGSFGPEIGNINYQIIGEMSADRLIYNLLHEGSHPIAKQVLKPFEKEISKKAYLLKRS